MKKQGKRLRDHAKEQPQEALSLEKALAWVQGHANAKFDETIEVALNLGIDPRQTDQAVRGMAALPHGTGKTVRIAVFARGEQAEAAKKAGADEVGAEDLAEKMQGGDLNFDRVVAEPALMPVVSRLGRVLGPRGLMPNPRLGTVATDVAAAVVAAKKGQVSFRADKGGIIHAGVGKASFSVQSLQDNVLSLVAAVQAARPTTAKGVYLSHASIATTMGLGVPVEIASFVKEGKSS